MRPPKKKKKPRKKQIQKEEVVERIIYILYWFDIAIYVGQSYRTAVIRAKQHRKYSYKAQFCRTIRSPRCVNQSDVW